MKAGPVLASLPLLAIDAIRAVGSPTAGNYARYSQRNEEAESKHCLLFLFIDILTIETLMVVRVVFSRLSAVRTQRGSQLIVEKGWWLLELLQSGAEFEQQQPQLSGGVSEYASRIRGQLCQQSLLLGFTQQILVVDFTRLLVEVHRTHCTCLLILKRFVRVELQGDPGGRPHKR